MYEAAKVRFRSLIESELAHSGGGDPSALRTVFAKLDASVESLITSKGLGDAQAAALRSALADAKAEHRRDEASGDGESREPPEIAARRPAPVTAFQPEPSPPARSFRRWAVGGIAAAAAVGAIILVPGIAAALQTKPERPDRHLAKFQARLDMSAKSVAQVTAYLGQVRKSLERRRKSDPVALTTLAGSGWVPLQTIDPKLFAKHPKSLSPSADIKVLATGEGYKVLLRSALCTDVKYIRPGFVDPKRDPKSVGCEYLAVWNRAGADF